MAGGAFRLDGWERRWRAFQGQQEDDLEVKPHTRTRSHEVYSDGCWLPQLARSQASSRSHLLCVEMALVRSWTIGFGL